MGCSAGYPEKECPFGFEGACTRQNCGPCKFFIPPPHILKWCQLWDRDKVLCLKPKSACAGCPEKCERPPGKPPGEGPVDWNDPASVREYHRKYREKNRDHINERMRKWREEHPDYYKDYYRKRKKDNDGAGEGEGGQE